MLLLLLCGFNYVGGRVGPGEVIDVEARAGKGWGCSEADGAGAAGRAEEHLLPFAGARGSQTRRYLPLSLPVVEVRALRAT